MSTTQTAAQLANTLAHMAPDFEAMIHHIVVNLGGTIVTAPNASEGSTIVATGVNGSQTLNAKISGKTVTVSKLA